MILTRKSEILLHYFYKKNLEPVSENKKTNKIFKKLFNELSLADEYVSNINIGKNIDIQKIETVAQIPKPEMFTLDTFPKEIREHINNSMTYSITYDFSLFGRKIKIQFIVESDSPDMRLDYYVKNILVWIYILNEYSSKKCSKEITIYLYFTEMFKELPKSSIDVLGYNNVNTAFTTTCPKVSEIVIYRKEEWFKVFIHETFHNFALDFSDMNNHECHNIIREIFPVNSHVNLFEAYTEFWAEVMNVCFYSFYTTKNFGDYLEHCYMILNIERKFGFFQMVKALNFMGLNYNLIHANINKDSHEIRKTLYKENTNVLAYYVITMILLNNFTGFMNWCDKNNTSLLQFKKTITNQKEFCKFIFQNSDSSSFLEGIVWAEKLFKTVSRKKSSEETRFLLKNMRMTVTEY